VLLATDYPLLNIIWTMLVFFGLVIWLRLLFTVFADLFSRHDISGWGKAAWSVFAIVLPFVGVLTYLGTQGEQMAERFAKRAQAAQAQADDHVRSVARSTEGAAAEIEKAKQLLDSGAITEVEFVAIKAKAVE
jgi:putative oligomerization/nucleic acid binding protein/phospholipase D-like protein